MSVPGLFANAKERLSLGGGEVLFAEGDAGDQMFGLVTGLIELRRGDQLVAHVEPGETFGEMAIIESAPRSLTAVAVEASEIAAIDRRTFLFLVHETPTFAIQVMQSLASRIRELDGRP